jgi:hypothetical protein
MIGFGVNVVRPTSISNSDTLTFGAGVLTAGWGVLINFTWDGTGQATITGDAAWSLVQVRNTVSGQDMSCASFWKIASAADAAGTSSYSFSWSASITHGSQFNAFSGTESVAPSIFGLGHNTTNAETAPSVNVVRAGSWILMCCSTFNSGGTYTTPTGLTARGTSGDGHSSMFDSNGSVAVGASGTFVSTYSVATGEWVAQTIAVQPPLVVSGTPLDDGMDDEHPDFYSNLRRALRHG